MIACNINSMHVAERGTLKGMHKIGADLADCKRAPMASASSSLSCSISLASSVWVVHRLAEDAKSCLTMGKGKRLAEGAVVDASMAADAAFDA